MKGGRGLHEKKKSVSSSVKAGIVFPVGRTMRKLRHMKLCKRIGMGAPVYLAAVLEYLSAELLEMSGNSARDNKRKRIIPRDLVLAIRSDEEMNGFIPKNTIIPKGGVLPSIHQALIKHKKGNKSKKSKTSGKNDDAEDANDADDSKDTEKAGESMRMMDDDDE